MPWIVPVKTTSKIAFFSKYKDEAKHGFFTLQTKRTGLGANPRRIVSGTAGSSNRPKYRIIVRVSSVLGGNIADPKEKKSFWSLAYSPDLSSIMQVLVAILALRASFFEIRIGDSQFSGPFSLALLFCVSRMSGATLASSCRRRIRLPFRPWPQRTR